MVNAPATSAVTTADLIKREKYAPSLAAATPWRDVPAHGQADPPPTPVRGYRPRRERRRGAGRPGPVAPPNSPALLDELFPGYRPAPWRGRQSHPVWIPRATSQHAIACGGRLRDQRQHVPDRRGG